MNTTNYFFGKFGGRFVPETIIPALEETEIAFIKYYKNKDFNYELNQKFKTFVGRETPLYFAKNLSEIYNAKIYLKREDLAHTGSHKINNALGQALLAKKMNKKLLIAETGAGQHGVATATVAANLNIKCKIFMGIDDVKRQHLNVQRMKLLGADVFEVKSGSKTLKDAVNEAMRFWASNINETYYVFGSALGPYPFPKIVKHFQSVIGTETKKQILEAEGKLPDYVIACVGGGSNSIGIFSAFLKDEKVTLIGVEAGGRNSKIGNHAARFISPKLGVLHGSYSYLLQKNGQVMPTHSIAAGLDYPMIGPEHAKLFHDKRALYGFVRDKEAIKAFEKLSLTEGIIPALESSHAIAYLDKIKDSIKNKLIIVNLSGRGDKDFSSYFDFYKELNKYHE